VIPDPPGLPACPTRHRDRQKVIEHLLRYHDEAPEEPSLFRELGFLS